MIPTTENGWPDGWAAWIAYILECVLVVFGSFILCILGDCRPNIR